MRTAKNTQKRQSKKKEIALSEREQQWYIPPSSGIPLYQADHDPFCPAARLRKFNQEQKQRIKKEVDNHSRSEQWVKAALDRQYTDVPLRSVHDFRAKASEYRTTTNAYGTCITDIQIIQKIIVRENLLMELRTLCGNTSNDFLLQSIINEVEELIKALRYETLDIVEDIVLWFQQQPMPRPFLFKGYNYLVKLKSDLDFLDEHEEVIERFCFEFKSNPLAYRGGGNIIVGFNALPAVDAFKPIIHSYQQATSSMIDGIDIVRLHNAEKVIQGEFQRIMQEQGRIGKLSLAEQSMQNYSQDAHAMR
jgi:hypothetical protein